MPGALDDLTPGRRRYSFVWYRPVDAATTLAEMQTDATGRVHSEGIPRQLIRPEVIAALRRDAEAMLPPVFAEILRTCAQPLFQPIGDLESPTMRHGRVALLAYYPYCYDSVQFSTPTLVLIGDKDDWTPAKLCEAVKDKPNL